jgi:hypothetical protein
MGFARLPEFCNPAAHLSPIRSSRRIAAFASLF